MMLRLGAFQHISLIGLLAVIAFTLVFAANQFRSVERFVVTTDLKALSPEFASDAGMQLAINTLSTDIENRFLLMASAVNAADAKAAAAHMAENLSQLSGVTAQPGGDTQKILQALSSSRFHLLTASQRQFLQDTPDNEIVEQATRKLYQFGSISPLLPLNEDPLGMFSGYVTESLGSLSRQSANGARARVPVYVKFAGGTLESGTQKQISSVLGGLMESSRQRYPQVEWFRSGVFFFANEAATDSRADVQRIGLVSLIGVITVLLITFYSLRPLVLPALSIAIGVGFALAATHSLMGSIHILTIVFGASLIGIVIDYSLHYFYHAAASDGAPRDRQALHSAMLLSLLSSLIGYAALAFSSLYALRQVALFSCLGLAAAWFCVMGLAPWLTGKRIAVSQKVLPPVVAGLTAVLRQVSGNRYFILGMVGIALLAVSLTGLRGNDSPYAFFNPSAQLVAEELEVAKGVGGFEPGRYFIVRSKQVETLYQKLDQLTATTTPELLTGIQRWLDSPGTQMANYQLQARLYRSAGPAEKVMQNIGLPASEFQNLQQAFVDAKNSVLTPVNFMQQSGEFLPALYQQQQDMHYAYVLLKKRADVGQAIALANTDDRITYIDTASASADVLKSQRRSAQNLLIAAFALIALVLVARSRRFSTMTMLVVPAVSILLTIAAVSAWGGGLTLFHTMALFLVLGLGMDYVIFVEEMRSRADTVRQAVFLSAITSLLSFGLLAWSSIPVVQAFGLTVLIGNSFNLIGSMVYSLSTSQSGEFPG